MVLCVLVLLNGNSIAVMAGLPERVFTIPLLGLCVIVLIGLRDEVRFLRFSPSSWTYLFAFGFVSIAMLSSLTSLYGDPEAVFGDWGVLRYVASLLLLSTGFCVATRVYSERRLDSLLKLLFWICTIAAISAYALPAIPRIADYLTFRDETNRLQGVFGNVNEMGLQSGYPVVIGLVISLRSRKAFWLILGSAAGAMGVIASFSKTAMLMLMLLMVLVAFEGWRARTLSPLIGWTVCLMGLLAVIVSIYLLSGTVHGTVNLSLDTEQQRRIEQLSRLLSTGIVDDETTTGRTSIWTEGLNIWLSSPLIGCGLTTFDRLPGTGLNSHNSLLVVLGESGLLGFALFLAMLFAWLSGILRCRQIEVRALGLAFLVVQSALWMSNGQAMSLRGHNLIAGCVLGLLVMARLVEAHRPGGKF